MPVRNLMPLLGDPTSHAGRAVLKFPPQVGRPWRAISTADAGTRILPLWMNFESDDPSWSRRG